jgi:hypothetical protein
VSSHAEAEADEKGPHSREANPKRAALRVQGHKRSDATAAPHCHYFDYLGGQNIFGGPLCLRITPNHLGIRKDDGIQLVSLTPTGFLKFASGE